MPPQFQLRCLGGAELRAPDGEPSRFRTRKHLALLVYLAVEPRHIHRRDRLADLLWPNVPAVEGRHSVATAVSVLRGKFGREAFESDRDHVRFVLPTLDLDLDRLAAGDVLETELLPALEVGGFLEDFDISDAPEFMLWREQQRARWLPTIREALVRLMDLCRRTGDFRGIERFADRMLALDELSEEGIRAKMEARAFDGDRLTALRIFESWERRLQEELGASPSAMLDGIALRLRRRGWERPTASNIPVVPTDQWRGRTFIGRAREYRALYEIWERTVKSDARHALVLGDPGIGKSTLVERLTTAAGLEGAATSRVQCYEVEREIPYSAIGSLVTGLLDRPGATGTPPEWLGELARTVSAVRQRFPAVPEPSESQGESARIRLTEAVHQLLTAVSEESPVILVVDDVHLADDASVAVLHLVMRRTQSQRIMVVLTAREAELAHSPNAARLRETQRQLGLTIVELPPMSEDESGQLLSSLVPSDQPQPSAMVRRAIVRAAAGYPMVLELLTGDWQSDGEHCLALSVDAMTADPGVAGAAEDAYRRILARIIRDLDVTTRNVLNLAAILGGRLNDLGMYPLVDLTMAQTMTGMAQLTELRLLRDGGQELEFRNEMIRAEAYMSVPSPLRRALHGQIADRLLEEESRGRLVSGLEVAWHCMRSGRELQATSYLLRGAREAIDQGAVFEVERALVTGTPHLPESDQSRASLLLAELLHAQERWAEARVLLQAVNLELVPEQADFHFVLTTAAEFNTSNHSLTCDLTAVRRLAALAHSDDLRLREHALALGSVYVQETKDPETTRLFLLAVGESLKTFHSEEHQIRLLIAAASVVNCNRLPEDRERVFSTLIQQLAKTKNHPKRTFLSARLLNTVGCIHTARGEYAKALETFQEAFLIARRLDVGPFSWRIAANIAMCHGRLGEYTEQERWSLTALEGLPAEDASICAYKAKWFLAWSYAMRGEFKKAITIVEGEYERSHGSWATWQRQAWLLFTADVMLLAGRGDTAIRFARSALSDGGELHSLDHGGMYARWLARIALADGQIADAVTQLNGMKTRLQEWDALDAAEILSASLILPVTQEGGRESLIAELWDRLAKLPPSTGDQLKKLGMLECLYQ